MNASLPSFRHGRVRRDRRCACRKQNGKKCPGKVPAIEMVCVPQVHVTRHPRSWPHFVRVCRRGSSHMLCMFIVWCTDTCVAVAVGRDAGGKAGVRVRRAPASHDALLRAVHRHSGGQVRDVRLRT